MSPAQRRPKGEDMAKGKAVAETSPEAETDHIDAHNAALDRMVEIATNAEFESGTLVGDIRDTLLDVTKNRPKPWLAMSEQEQRDLAKAFENVAKTFIRKAVQVVAEQDEISVVGTLKGYSAKGGQFSLKVEAQGDEETANQLFRMDGHDLVLMSADASRFMGQKKDPTVDKDQPEIPFADEDVTDEDLVSAAEEPEEAGNSADELETESE